MSVRRQIFSDNFLQVAPPIEDREDDHRVTLNPVHQAIRRRMIGWGSTRAPQRSGRAAGRGCGGVPGSNSVGRLLGPAL